jgi:hypothetical protein
VQWLRQAFPNSCFAYFQWWASNSVKRKPRHPQKNGLKENELLVGFQRLVGDTAEACNLHCTDSSVLHALFICARNVLGALKGWQFIIIWIRCPTEIFFAYFALWASGLGVVGAPSVSFFWLRVIGKVVVWEFLPWYLNVDGSEVVDKSIVTHSFSEFSYPSNKTIDYNNTRKINLKLLGTLEELL